MSYLSYYLNFHNITNTVHLSVITMPGCRIQYNTLTSYIQGLRMAWMSDRSRDIDLLHASPPWILTIIELCESQVEVYVCQFLQTQPVPVDRNTEVAQVDRLLSHRSDTRHSTFTSMADSSNMSRSVIRLLWDAFPR